ncbi:unnamed protein product, partial [Ceratitis capitata]
MRELTLCLTKVKATFSEFSYATMDSDKLLKLVGMAVCDQGRDRVWGSLTSQVKPTVWWRRFRY